MKKILLIILLCPLLSVAQTKPKPDSTKFVQPAQTPPPKPLTVTLSIEDWNTVLYVIRQSNAPYPVVTKVQEEILLPQLQKQLDSKAKKD